MEQPKQPGLSPDVLRRNRRMRQGVITACRMAFEQFDGPQVAQFFLTLTYRPGAEWAPEQITLFTQRLRDHAKRKLGGVEMAYVWKLELTKAGVPHYHVALWIDGQVYLPKLDDSGFWPHGMTRVQRMRNGVGYMAKYLGKSEEMLLPTGARLWGFGGLDGERRGELRWWRSPRWLRKLVPLEAGVKRLKGGWWQRVGTLFCYKSPFVWDWLDRKTIFHGWDGCFDMSGLVVRLNGVLTTEEEWAQCYV